MLKLVEGIDKIAVNVPLRQVVVDHNPKVIAASDIAHILIKNHLGGIIKRNGASTCGRSSFYVQHICCAAEIPPIRAIVEKLDGVSKVSVNVTSKIVYVDHESSIVSAQNICDALNKEKFGAILKHNAVDGEALVTFVTSTPIIERIDTARLATFFDSFDPSQVQSYHTDASEVKVVHNAMQLTAQGCLDKLLNETGMTGIVSNVFDSLQPRRWIRSICVAGGYQRRSKR